MNVPQRDAQFLSALSSLKPKHPAVQHDEHYRAYLWEISSRGETVIRMPDGFLHLEEYTVIANERWCFTEKGTPVFAGVE